jgi:type IV secretory pathway TrbL component
MLLKGFSNWSLKMLQVMCCNRASMLLLAIGIYVRTLNTRGVKKQPDCTWIEVNKGAYICR